MIITTDSLKSAICRRKTWLAYDCDKMDTLMNKLINNAYDRYVDVSGYGNYSNRDYTTSTYPTYSDIISFARSVYRPIIDYRSIHVDCPNSRSDIRTYYWGFQ